MGFNLGNFLGKKLSDLEGAAGQFFGGGVSSAPSQPGAAPMAAPVAYHPPAPAMPPPPTPGTTMFQQQLANTYGPSVHNNPYSAPQTAPVGSQQLATAVAAKAAAPVLPRPKVSFGAPVAAPKVNMLTEVPSQIIGGIYHTLADPIVTPYQKMMADNAKLAANSQPGLNGALNTVAAETGNFAKGIGLSGLNAAPFFAPEIKGLQAGADASGLAKFGTGLVAHGATSAPLSVAGSLANGDRDPGDIAKNAAIATLMAGTVPGLESAAVKALPATTVHGYYAGEQAAGFDKAKAANIVDNNKDGPGFEVQDHGAKYNPGGQTLGAVFQHPRLYQDYPGLENLSVRYDRSLKPNEGGYYDPQAGEMVLNPRNSKPLMEETIRHETQHVIDTLEGREHGGDVPQSVSFEKDVLPRNSHLQGVPERLAQIDAHLASNDFTTIPVKARYRLQEERDVLQSQVDEATSQEKWRQYWNQAGEVRARNAGRRGTAPIADQKPFNETNDVPADEQIYSKQSGKPKASMNRTEEEPPTPAPDKVLTSDEYAAKKNQDMEDAAKPKSPQSFMQKAKAKLIDSFAPIEDPVYKATGGFHSEEGLKLRNAIDNSLRSGTQAREFINEQGFQKTVHDVQRKGGNLKTFTQYLIAKHAQDLEKNGVKTGRDLKADQRLIDDKKGQYEEHAQNIYKYNRSLLDKAVEHGLISKDNAEFLKSKYQNYVPMERIFHEDELQNANKSGSAPASLSRQDIVRRIKGSEREIVDPLHSIIGKTKDVFRQGLQSDAARAVAETRHIEGNPLRVTALRLAENVKARMDLYGKAAELRPVQRKLARMLVTRNRWARTLSSEINKLNIKGLNTKLKENPEQPAKGQAFRYRNNEAVVGAETTAKKRGVKNIGAAREVSGQGKTDLKIDGGASAKDTKALVNSLVNMPSADILRIKAKIATRENNLAPILDQIAQMSDDLAKVKQQRADMFSEAKLHADAQSRNREVISTYKDGIKELYEVDPAVASAAKYLNREQLGFLGKVFSVGVRVLRLGATAANPAFALANTAKDIATGLINSSHGLQYSLGNPKVFLQALAAAVYHGGKSHAELVQMGAGGTSFDLGREEAHTSLAEIASHRNVVTRGAYLVTHPSQLLTAVEDTIGRSEEFGRGVQYFGAKQAGIDRGMGMDAAKTYGADAARNNTVNFSRMGDVGQVLNAAVAYLNAGVQGSRTLVRNLKEHPTTTTAKLATVVFTPIAAATAWNLSDPNRKKAYDNITDTEKQNNIIIIMDGAKQDPKTGRWSGIIKIPLSQEVANLGNIVRNGVESMKKDKKFDFGALVGNLVGAGTSLNTQSPRALASQLTPQFGKPAVEWATNQNLYTGQKTVPDSMANLPANQQVSKNTSGTAKVLGGLTGQSPLKIDNALHTTFGGVEQPVAHLTDQALAATGVIKPSDVKGRNFIQAMGDRFVGANGTTEGTQFFNSISAASTANHLSGSDYNGLQTVLSKGYDGDGNSIPSNEKTAAEHATILFDSPKAAQVISDAAKARAAASGQPLSPQYQLSPAHQAITYQLQSVPYKSDEYNHISDANKDWLQPYQKALSAFFAANPTQNQSPTDRVPYPAFSPSTQANMTKYTTLDSTQKNAFIDQHPDVQTAFQAIDKYTNDRRVAAGFDPLKTYPQPSSYVNAQLKAKNYKDPQVSAYLTQTAAYELSANAGLAKFQGTDLNQKALGAAYSLGNYDISKTQGANGANQYALAGTPGFTAGGTASGSRVASSSSNSSAKNAIKSLNRYARGTAKAVGRRKSGSIGKAKLRAGRGGAIAKDIIGKPKVSLKSSLV